ncbi:MAG TPA: hypothetical protein PKA41_10705 [Verrucomicrobiota bacterium]|nr:hypothetical protein [Verrucomicrobiota bacterium]
MTNEQMELGYDGVKLQVPPTPRQRRTERATWWFAQMRRVVNEAIDWQPAPAARPEQSWFPGTHREVKV